MIKKVLSVFIILAALIGTSISFAEPPKEITVSAAISLKNAFEEIGKLYETKNKGAKVVFNFGASGDLARQIEGGAPVDVFASAAQKDMDALDQKMLIAQGTRANFVANAVVLVVPINAKTDLKSFEQLTSAGIKKIAAGNPKTVPAGRYAEEVFNHYKILDGIKSRLIYTENVRQALDYVARGEVDAGVVYSTDAMNRAKEVRIVTTAPGQSHKPVIYPIAVIKGTKNESASKAFVSLVTSPEGQKILERFGFKSAK